MQYYSLLVLCLALLGSSPSKAEENLLYGCEPLARNTVQQAIVPSRFDHGLLWQVDKPGQPASYVFGTIHVSTPEIKNLPRPVSTALQRADRLVVEAVPTPKSQQAMQRMMFFQDGQQLDRLILPHLWQRTVEILEIYKIPRAMSIHMKPWAAFLVMNYPPPEGDGIILDLKIISIANALGIPTQGLETMAEQIEIFTDLTVAQQIQLLTDSVCHYNIFTEDLKILKAVYMARELGKLYRMVNKYTLTQEARYQTLFKQLILARNDRMVARIQPILQAGNTFIAVGALHLVGPNGILQQLATQGYQLTRLY